MTELDSLEFNHQEVIQILTRDFSVLMEVCAWLRALLQEGEIF